MIPVGILTAAATSSFSFLLDQFPGANAAYSLRKLRSAYTGAAVRVRNGATGTELDIGFTSNGDFDTVALINFVGVSPTGTISVWYDQSGNSNNATNTSANGPLIYDSGVVTYNSRTSMKNSGNKILQTSTATGAGNGIRYISAYIAYNLTTVNLVNYLTYETGTEFGIVAGGSYPGLTGFGNGTVQANNETTNNILKLGGIKTSTNQNVFFNGSLAATGSTGSISSFMYLFSGVNFSNQNHLGGISEMIFYNSDQSANNTGINNNINSYYTIY